MAISIFPDKWNTSPSGPLTINWGHPLAQYLVAAIVAQSGTLYDLVARQILTRNVGGSVNAAVGNDVAGILHGAQVGYRIEATPTVRRADGLTVFAHGLHTATPGINGMLFGVMHSGAAVSPYGGCLLATDGSSQLQGMTNSNGTLVQALGVTAIPLLKPVTYSFHASGLGQTLMQDGRRLIETTTSVSPILFSATTYIAAGDSWNTSSNSHWIQDIGYVWAGPQMKAVDLSWLHAEPFALIRTQTIRRFFFGFSAIYGVGGITVAGPAVDGAGVLSTSGTGDITIGAPVVSGTGPSSSVVPSPGHALPQWTTSRLFHAPPGQTGVSITPNATPWANSDWVLVDPATEYAWDVAGIVVHPDTLADTKTFEIDLGIGAVGAQAAIDLFGGHYGKTFYVSPGILPRSVLLNAIPKGSAVWVRLRKSGTSVDPWTVEVDYFRKPIVGSMVASAKPQHRVPAAADNLALTVGASAYLNSTWTQIIASTSTAIAIVGLIPEITVGEWEVDIGVGSLGAEVVVDTYRFHHTAILEVDGPTLIPRVNPLSAIPAASRVTLRTRVSDPAFHSAAASLLYLELPL